MENKTTETPPPEFIEGYGAGCDDSDPPTSATDEWMRGYAAGHNFAYGI